METLSKLGILLLFVCGATGLSVHNQEGSDDSIIGIKKEWSSSRIVKEYPCPAAEDIAPCICTAIDEGNMDMDCSAVSSDEELKAIFAHEMPFFVYTSLTIIGSTGLNILDSQSFGLCSFKIVNISGTSLTLVEDSTFALSEPTLVELKMTDNKLQGFPFDGLNNYVQLTVLDLSGNEFTEGIHIESPSLQILDLSGNPGLNIDSSLFGPCPNLQEVYIKTCNLDTIGTSMFSPLTQIVTIDLSDNVITSLATDAVNPTVDGDETLANLRFDNNPITSVDVDFVSGYNDVFKFSMAGAELTEINEEYWHFLFTTVGPSSINVDGNPLRCGCDLEWIFQNNTLYYKRLVQSATCRDGYVVADIANTDVYDYHCN